MVNWVFAILSEFEHKKEINEEITQFNWTILNIGTSLSYDEDFLKFKKDFVKENYFFLRAPIFFNYVFIQSMETDSL